MEKILLPSRPSITCFNFKFSCSLPRKTKAKRKRLQLQRQTQFQQKPRTKHSFPESSPTPLLTNRRPYPQSKLEALEAIITDIETSIKRGIRIDTEIYSSLLETCFYLRAIDHGIRIHNLIPKNLVHRNIGISSKLLRLYASNGLIKKAQQVFDEMYKRNECSFAWNSLIAGYAQLGLYEDALAVYLQMEEEGVEPDRYTFPRALKACAGIRLIGVGEEIHRHVVRCGFWNDGFVLNALVDMYAKCGDIVKARKVFDKIYDKDLVSWNSMLTGYMHHGLLGEALSVFHDMVNVGVVPDSVAVSTILAGLPRLKIIVQIHAWVIRRGLEWSLSVANSLIVAYSSHGMLNASRWIFEQMTERDVVSWNSIITAHCKDSKALNYFYRMEHDGVLPDNVTFVSILSACAYLGLVEDGEKLFCTMRERYGISPIMEHYACMVNLYGKAGLIDKAYEMVTKRMEFEPGPTVWGALLYACYVHGNIDIGEISAECLFELELDNEHNFHLLMNIYRNAGFDRSFEPQNYAIGIWLAIEMHEFLLATKQHSYSVPTRKEYQEDS
ncbi:Pentatricopeptide repeat [Dillenia turbinata]|uniref:Pentatricopeptide repeat n=1 Tax=Dillenia turbinata TaxID=194707 RepID=A0AAN8V4A1_9MAGN